MILEDSKMVKIIHSLTLEDFRSFDQKTVEFDEVTCLIGANESGKTNLLDAINLAKKIDPGNPSEIKSLLSSDIRKNSLRHSSNTLPILRYEFDRSLIKDKNLINLFINTETITLIRDGNSFDVEIPSNLTDIKIIKNISGDKISIINNDSYQNRENVDASNEDENTKEKVTTIDNLIIPTNEVLILDKKELEKFNGSINQAVEMEKVVLIEDIHLNNEITQEIKAKIISEININLKIFFWKYDVKNYLPEMVEINDIKTNFDNLPVIEAIFKLGGFNKAEVLQFLEGRTETDLGNIFSIISDRISNKINIKWQTNKDLKIKISHIKDHIRIDIEEPGYRIEPQYRSLGFRWFLAFIIGMISVSDELKNHLILIDEPALHLHPGGQKDVLKEINDIALENQIIYTTHSHFMIDRRYKERVRFLIKTFEKGYSLTDVKIPSKQDIFRDPLLRSALIYSVSDISFINEKNILVEGVFEVRIINLISNWIRENLDKPTIDPNDTSIINCSGAPEIAKNANLYKSNGLICVSLYDSDPPGETAYNHNNFQEPEEKIKIKDVYNQGKTTEDLIPVSIFKEGVRKWIEKNQILSESQIKQIKIPRMSKIDKGIASFLRKEKLEGEAYSKEKMKIKHDFEDCIYFETKNALDKVEKLSEDFNHLLCLNSIIIERLTDIA